MCCTEVWYVSASRWRCVALEAHCDDDVLDSYFYAVSNFDHPERLVRVTW